MCFALFLVNLPFILDKLIYFFLKYELRVSNVTIDFLCCHLTPKLVALTELQYSPMAAHLLPQNQASKECQSLCSSEADAPSNHRNLVNVICKEKYLTIILCYVQNNRLPTGFKLIIGFSSNFYPSETIRHSAMY